MLNITVRIFSYGIGGDETKCEWTEVCPDPEMAATAHFPTGWVPDLYMYNCDQSHYDLLVSENHRLALLGLIASKGCSVQEFSEEKENEKEEGSDDDGWKHVGFKKKNQEIPQVLLSDTGNDDYDDIDLQENDEEITLARTKKSGHRRTDSSAPPESLLKKERHDSPT